VRYAALGALFLALGLGAPLCIEKEPQLDDDDTSDCPEPFDGEMTETYDEIYNPDGVWREHEDSVDGELCFDCHLCSNNDAEPIDNTHYVCKHCHEENGDINATGSGCECGDLDCDADPPVLTCANCHTDGCNGHASADQMNALCDFCHINPEAP